LPSVCEQHHNQPLVNVRIVRQFTSGAGGFIYTFNQQVINVPPPDACDLAWKQLNLLPRQSCSGLFI